MLFLVWARSQQRAFHLPGGDGVAITLAGGWAVLLLVWRLFDKPDIQGAGATMGIQWGIFGALLAAGALIVAGARVRAVHAPEPPNPAADDTGWVAAAAARARPAARPAPARRDRGDRDAARPARAWEGEARRALDEETTRAPRLADDPLPDAPDERTRRSSTIPRAPRPRVCRTTRPRRRPAASGARSDTPPLWEDDARRASMRPSTALSVVPIGR